MNDRTDLEPIAAWMRQRGDVMPPPDLLSRAREQALSRAPVRRRLALAARPAIGWLAAALVLAAAVATILPAASGPTPQPTSAPAAAVPLVLLIERAGGTQLVAADPATGRPLDGAPRVDAGHHQLTSLSPDGRTLALVSLPGNDVAAGRLELIDLATWQVTPTDIRVGPAATTPTWSPDSRELVWFQPTRHAGQYSIPRAFMLLRWTVGTTAAVPSVTLPDDFMPDEARMLEDGSLAVYGQPIDLEYLASDVPHVLRVDLATAAVTADRPLDGVVAGQRRDPSDADRFTDDRPAVAWDLARSRLLVVGHDQLTRVDLTDDLRTTTMAIKPRASLLDQVLAFVVPAARAKIPQPGERLTAQLGPAGDRLYVTGSVVRPEGEGAVREPLGVRVVDPDDGALLATLDAPVDELVLTGDGTRLLLSGTSERYGLDAIEPITSDLSDLLLVRADDLGEVVRLPAPPSAVGRALSGASADGRLGYVLTATPATIGFYQTLEVVDLSAGTLSSLDLRERLLGVLPLGI